jgi:hypothetical protein
MNRMQIPIITIPPIMAAFIISSGKQQPQAAKKGGDCGYGE